jgi:hypothetical protein
VPIRNEHQTTTGEMKAMRDDIRSMENRILLEIGRPGGPVGDPPSSAAPVDKRPSRRGEKRR